MFINNYPELIDIVIKYSFYLSYFKENFDYSFGRPHVDVCSKCEQTKRTNKIFCGTGMYKNSFFSLPEVGPL